MSGPTVCVHSGPGGRWHCGRCADEAEAPALVLVQEDAYNGPGVLEDSGPATARAPRGAQLELGVIVPSEWHRNPTADLLELLEG